MTGTSLYPLDPRLFPPVRGEAGFPFFVVTSVELSYTFYKRTHTYIYISLSQLEKCPNVSNVGEMMWVVFNPNVIWKINEI